MLQANQRRLILVDPKVNEGQRSIKCFFTLDPQAAAEEITQFDK